MAEAEGFALACGLGQGRLCLPPAAIHHRPVRILSYAKQKSTTRVLFVWRRQRDSNPRGVAPKRFSRPPRYDRFDMPPSKNIKLYLICNGFQDSCPPPSNSHLSVFADSHRNAPYFGRSRFKKTILNRFFSLAHYDRFDVCLQTRPHEQKHKSFQLTRLL